MDPELIDRIYECSFIPELWPGVLAELAGIAEAPGGSLVIAKDGAQYWTASPGSHERAEQLVRERWFWRGTLLARATAARHAGFLTVSDLFTPEELAQEPVFRDFWHPQGFGFPVGTIFSTPTGEYVTFVMTRLLDSGPVDRDAVHKLD